MVPDREDGHPATAAMNRLGSGDREPTPAGQNANQLAFERWLNDKRM